MCSQARNVGNANAAAQKRIDEVSSNVVAVLQAGAFFGALGSAPVSCESLFLSYTAYHSIKPRTCHPNLFCIRIPEYPH